MYIQAWHAMCHASYSQGRSPHGFRAEMELAADQKAGTIVKYVVMANRKRRMYCLGEIMVGSLPPARMPVDLTHVSSCLSHVNCAPQQALR